MTTTRRRGAQAVSPEADRAAEGNREQARAWDGDEGRFWAEHADSFDRGVASYHRALMERAAVRPADRVLDLGCGAGQTTIEAARAATDGSALGVDLSAPLLEVARTRAGALTNVRFEQADAQVHPFEEAGFDLALSRTGCMFFADLVAAFTNVAHALAPDGRLALAVWQPVTANPWLPTLRGALAAGRDLPAPPPDAPGPFTLGDPDRVRAVLGAAGFEDVALEDVRAPMCFGETAEAGYDFVLGQFGWIVEAATRERALSNLRAVMRDHLTPRGVELDSAMWLVTARRP